MISLSVMKPRQALSIRWTAFISFPEKIDIVTPNFLSLTPLFSAVLEQAHHSRRPFDPSRRSGSQHLRRAFCPHITLTYPWLEPERAHVELRDTDSAAQLRPKISPYISDSFQSEVLMDLMWTAARKVRRELEVFGLLGRRKNEIRFEFEK
jgi:hypothetical protein